VKNTSREIAPIAAINPRDTLVISPLRRITAHAKSAVTITVPITGK
jgi:hypothetical protein